MCRKMTGCLLLLLVWGLRADAATSGLAVRVNFQQRLQPAREVPVGYLPDYGDLFGDRGNGWSYGWTVDKTASARDRDMTSDQRYDTLNALVMWNTGTGSWEIAVPNGTYNLFIVGGDPGYLDATQSYLIESTTITDPTPYPPGNTTGNRYDEYNVTVTVTDGRLTVAPAPGVSGYVKISFIHIADARLAQQVSPPDRGLWPSTAVLLEWTPGVGAAQHDVYLGESFNDVNAATTSTSGIYKGRQTQAKYPASETPMTLEAGKTYYWRVDEVSGADVWKGEVWTFKVQLLTAYDSQPLDGGIFVDPNVVLRWTKGATAASHLIYFGESYDSVNNATTSSPEYRTTQPVGTATWDPPGSLTLGKTYYWRVDEKEAGATVYKGAVWSFTVTTRYGEGLKAQYYDNMGLTGNPVLIRTDRQVDFDWGSGSPDPNVPADGFSVHWIGQIEIPASGEWTFSTHTDDGVRLWVNGQRLVNVWTGNSRALAWDSNTISLEAGFYPVVMDYFDINYAGHIAIASLSWQGPVVPVRQVIPAGAFGPPLAASNPVPTDHATDASDTATLRWQSGERAVQHSVYFGTDANAVAAAAPATAGIFRGTLPATRYAPTEVPLTWGQTYYWRVDEVNTADLTSPWRGVVWSFTVGRLVAVDDFEAYDEACDRIYYSWRDGGSFGANPDCSVAAYGGNGTGATVGSPDAEQVIFHGGRQSMPVRYFNVNPPYYSEAQREWPTGQDWTRKGVKSLTLWFRGVPADATTANAPTTLYIIIQDSSGQSKTLTHSDPNAALQTAWQEWNIDLRDISSAGVNLASIKKMTIGMDNRANIQTAGIGTMYFDDIVLYPPRCRPDVVKPACDLNDDCIVDYRDLDLLATDWLLADQVITTAAPGNTGLVGYWPLDGNTNDTSGNGNPGILGGSPVWVAAGQIGGALQFNGSTDYLDCGAAAIFDLTARVTLSAWVRTADSGNGGYNPYIGKGDTSYHLQHDTSNSIEFVIYDTGAWYNARYSVNSSFNNVWHHVAGTYDGGQLKVYVDGLLRATTDHAGAIAPNTFSVSMGRNSEQTARYYAGLLDDVRIYSRDLSAAEIAYLADTTPADGRLHVAVQSPAEFYSAEPDGSQKINFRDYAVLASAWLEQKLWPQP